MKFGWFSECWRIFISKKPLLTLSYNGIGYRKTRRLQRIQVGWTTLFSSLKPKKQQITPITNNDDNNNNNTNTVSTFHSFGLPFSNSHEFCAHTHTQKRQPTRMETHLKRNMRVVGRCALYTVYYTGHNDRRVWYPHSVWFWMKTVIELCVRARECFSGWFGCYYCYSPMCIFVIAAMLGNVYSLFWGGRCGKKERNRGQRKKKRESFILRTFTRSE